MILNYSIKLIEWFTDRVYRCPRTPPTQDFLRGVKNLPKSNRKIKKRKAVSFPMLRLLGSEICKSDWSGYDKTLTWTSFLLSYFGNSNTYYHRYTGEVIIINEGILPNAARNDLETFLK